MHRVKQELQKLLSPPSTNVRHVTLYIFLQTTAGRAY